MPARENNSVQHCGTSLTTREQRVLGRAERTIARGSRSFLAVGMTLKEICDKRLYRQHYDMFEDYSIRRWELSRPRAYAFCADAEVVADLSPIGDIRLLPENEDEARPLTWLKAPEHRQRAWEITVQMAPAERRPVTARHTEVAVQKLGGRFHMQPTWADGGPVFNCLQGTNADLIAAAVRLYQKKGDHLGDITFGRGVFWQKVNLSDYLLYKSDKVNNPVQSTGLLEGPHRGTNSL